MGSLSRDHVSDNLLDQLDELRRRLDGLERSALRGIIGPYVPDDTTTITGYLNLTIHEEGVPSPYRLAIADTAAAEPIEISGQIPIGGIIGWSGSVNDIPAHWHLCDGAAGTPDMRDKFIIGAGSTYAVGATGGAATIDTSHSHGDGTLAAAVGAHHHHQSTLATDSDTHSHSGTTNTGSAHTHAKTLESVAVQSGSGTTVVQDVTINNESLHTHAFSTSEDAHVHAITGEVGGIQGASTGDVSGSTATGGSTTENNFPPYYAAAWIMRIS
jgi:hypothetical protein